MHRQKRPARTDTAINGGPEPPIDGNGVLFRFPGSRCAAAPAPRPRPRQEQRRGGIHLFHPPKTTLGLILEALPLSEIAASPRAFKTALPFRSTSCSENVEHALLWK